MIAQRVKSLPFDVIQASPMARASQTAEIIKEAVSCQIVYNDLLKEHKRPSALLGQRTDSPEAAKINKECNLHQNDSLWHYSDEESIL
jgi:broad specificity phosphatase PhoE